MKKVLTFTFIVLLLLLSGCGNKKSNMTENYKLNEEITTNKWTVSNSNKVSGSWTVDVSFSLSSGDNLKAKKTWGKNIWKVDKNEGADMWF